MCTYLDLDRTTVDLISCIILILLFKKNDLDMIYFFYHRHKYTKRDKYRIQYLALFTPYGKQNRHARGPAQTQLQFP